MPVIVGARFPRPMDWETQPLRRILGLILIRIQNASKTPDESGNYNHSMRVTY